MADLLRVGLVPESLLHEPLVRPQPAVSGRHALFVLVQLARESANAHNCIVYYIRGCHALFVLFQLIFSFYSWLWLSCSATTYLFVILVSYLISCLQRLQI